jgi:curli production assembly/transport component CsgG
VYSTLVDANILKYFAVDKLFQAEAGFSVNEPVQLAVRQAIETAVYSLIMEGALDKLWSFKNPAAGQVALDDYLERRDGRAPERAMRISNKNKSSENEPFDAPSGKASSGSGPHNTGEMPGPKSRPSSAVHPHTGDFNYGAVY